VKADPKDLAYYLTKLTDKDLREKMGAEGRKFVLEKFDLQVSAKKLVGAIEETYRPKS
jgi:glycosyltransferase involved in cell wall biosynthesis